ncbi:histone deacetylase [Pseudoalteromonas sp. MMG022]|uniref:Histone deacetylase n=2 Tax=Pseudoalteromonas TaxID=53246 RepID=A0A1S1N280_9GAMM|nr:histone deacetylase [Pseudoalteromonas sp. MMG022]MCF6436256.1 histone deacetylase [Pseudoalteromonas sp. MMG022]OHU91714.1 histone deacetylase [Pseudoalteromonas sp. JW3]OHU92291.1 histone deacetylase [Pseudoalteromonas amylolytica]
MLFYHPSYSALSLPPRHRFPIQKYVLLKDQLVQLQLQNKLVCPSKVNIESLLLCHDANYVQSFINGTLSEKAIRKMGFPWSKALVERTLYSVGGSIEAANCALKHGVAANLSGGYHHAHKGFGSGFCIINDFAVAACYLIQQALAETIVIFDCDVHQGDGTASILTERSDIITCSIHCEQNFPRNKAESDYDFPLAANAQDEAYLDTVHQALSLVCRLHSPDLILYNAGADIYKQDELGLLNVSLDGVLARDKLVMDYCRQNNIPMAAAMGGGYQKNITQLVDVHKQFFVALTANPAIMI